MPWEFLKEASWIYVVDLCYIKYYVSIVVGHNCISKDEEHQKNYYS